MPDTFATLTDLVAHEFGLDPEMGNDLLQDAPFVRVLPMIPSSNGDKHSWAKRISAPTIGWRDVNAGRELSKSGKQKVTASLKILDFSFQIDQALPKASPTRPDPAFLEEEGLEHLAEALSQFDQQLIRGKVQGDPEGIDGFYDAATVLNSDSEMVVDAGGTTPDTASSVIAVRIGARGVRGVYKGDGDPFQINQAVTIKADDGAGGTYPAWYTSAFSWLGLEIKDKFAVGRITNLTEDADKGLTDDLIAKLIAKFPAGRKPTHFLMSRRSQEQLRASRTATNQDGNPAPIPERVYNTPIVVTDSIADTEPLVAAA